MQRNESLDIFAMEDRLYAGLDAESECGGRDEDCNAEADEEMRINPIKEFGRLKLMQELQLHHSLPIDANFMDLLCVNCYECIKLIDVNKHSLIC